MRAQRTFNVEIGVFGVVESGKTHKALQIILDMQRREALYVIAQDVSFNIPDRLFDGRATRVRRYQTVSDAEKGLNSAPGGIHAIAEEDSEKVFDFARRVADRSMLRHTPGGRSAIESGRGRGIPVLLYLDESVDSAAANPRRLGDSLRKLVSKRRAYNVGLIFSSQYPRQVHYALGMQATDIIFFQLDSVKDVKRLTDDYGVPYDLASRSLTLTGHQYIHYDKKTKRVSYGNGATPNPKTHSVSIEKKK